MNQATAVRGNKWLHGRIVTCPARESCGTQMNGHKKGPAWPKPSRALPGAKEKTVQTFNRKLESVHEVQNDSRTLYLIHTADTAGGSILFKKIQRNFQTSHT